MKLTTLLSIYRVGEMQNITEDDRTEIFWHYRRLSNYGFSMIEGEIVRTAHPDDVEALTEIVQDLGYDNPNRPKFCRGYQENRESVDLLRQNLEFDQYNAENKAKIIRGARRGIYRGDDKKSFYNMLSNMMIPETKVKSK